MRVNETPCQIGLGLEFGLILENGRLATAVKRKKSVIDQILASTCFSRQNEHIDIKRVAYNHVTAILQRCQRAKNVSFFFFQFFVTLFIFTQFSGIIEDTDIINTI